MELIAFLWVVGWLYACGVTKGYRENAYSVYHEEEARTPLYEGYARLFFTWPHYLGYKK